MDRKELSKIKELKWLWIPVHVNRFKNTTVSCAVLSVNIYFVQILNIFLFLFGVLNNWIKGLKFEA